MFIEYTHPSPRAGVQEHQSQTTAAALIAAGLAREVILSEEEKRDLRFGNFRQAPARPPVPEWDVIRTVESGDLVVVRKCRDSVLYFDSPPDHTKWPDCPKDIEKKFGQMRKPNEPRTALPFVRKVPA